MSDRRNHNIVADILAACVLWRGMISYRPAARHDLKALQADLAKLRRSRTPGNKLSEYHSRLARNHWR